MKHRQITGLICGGILSISTSALLAQQSPSTIPGSPSTTPGSSSSSQSQGSSLGSQSSSSSSLGAPGSLGSGHSSWSSGNGVRLSNLMSSTVQSQDGKTLGYIRDLVVDPQSGRVQFAILSLSNAGGVADTSTSGRETVPSSRSSVSGIPSSTSGSSMTGKLIPVPWQMFGQSFSSTSGRSISGSPSATGTTTVGQPLVLNFDESKLRSAPSFDASNWNDLSTLDHRVYSYYGVDRNSGTGTYGSSISGQGTSSTQDHSNKEKSATQGTTTTPDRSPNTSPDK